MQPTRKYQRKNISMKHIKKYLVNNLYEYESNLTRIAIALTKIHLAWESIDGLVSPVFVSIPGSHQTISCYLGTIHKERGQIFGFFDNRFKETLTE